MEFYLRVQRQGGVRGLGSHKREDYVGGKADGGRFFVLRLRTCPPSASAGSQGFLLGT